MIVPETITLPKLHQAHPGRDGWLNCRLYEFEIARERYGIPDPDYDYGESVRTEQRVRLATALGEAKSFRYVYDFGDDWGHRIAVERRRPCEPLFDMAESPRP